MWISKTEYKKAQERTAEFKNMINSLQTELHQIKSSMPYKSLLIATPCGELRSIARHVYGIPDEYIEKTCTNKAHLIEEILAAKNELEEIK